MSEEQTCSLTLLDFHKKLSERVSDYNARLLMQSVMIEAGIVKNGDDQRLNLEEAKSLCLGLIKKGGPAFQVGKVMYSQVQ